MAMRFPEDATLVHTTAPYTVEEIREWRGVCGCAPANDPLRVEFAGVAKITKAPSAYLRQARNYALPGDLIAIRGPVARVRVKLTIEEAWSGLGIPRPVPPCGLRNTLKEVEALFYAYETYVTVSVPAFLVEAIHLGVLKASQEKTTREGVGSIPVQTRIEKLYEDSEVITPDPGSPFTACLAHRAAVHFAAVAVAEGRGVVVDAVGRGIRLPDGPEESDDEDVLDVAAEENATGMIIQDRVSGAPSRPLRDSVVVTVKTQEQLEGEVQMGIRRPDQLPDADEVPITVTTEQIGPNIIPVRAPMASCLTNEIKGVERHLAAGTRGQYTDKAYERFQDAVAVVRESLIEEFARHELFKEAKLPEKWGECLREAVAEAAPFERLFKLAGFLKSGELGLNVDKRPRLIGNPGPYEAGAQAELLSIFEQYFAYLFPGLVTKGLTLEETDERLREVLEENKKTKRKLASCDFAAMDSSWHPHEKKMVVELVQECARHLVDALVCPNTVDPCDFAKLQWRLREIIVSISWEDMILFSGERGTSIYNRLLVLILRTAEIMRLRGGGGKTGRAAAIAFWAHNRRRCPAEEGDTDVGDGDDTVFTADDYDDEKAIVDAYTHYGKTIEPVISTTALEVLSRYCFLSKGGKFYALVKPHKNMERATYAIRQRTAVIDGVVSRGPTAHEHAQWSTASYQRAIAAKQTPVVRQYAMLIGDYHRKVAKEGGSYKAVMDQDLFRKLLAQGKLAVPEGATSSKDVPLQSLDELAEEARDQIVAAEVSGYVMENWVHFPYGTKTKCPTGNVLSARALDWMAADANVAECVIGPDDFGHPEPFMDRMGLTVHVAEVLGVSNPKLLKCCSVGVTPAAAARSDRSDEPEQGGGVDVRNDKKKKFHVKPGSESRKTRTANASSLPRESAPSKGKKATPRSERSTTVGVAAHGKKVEVARSWVPKQ